MPSLTVREAIEIQNRLRPKVVTRDDFGPVRTIAGVDVSIRRGRARGAFVLLEYPSLRVLEERTLERKVEFPYVPGLLAFRELPVLLQLLKGRAPDLIMVDAHGLAHPRRFGLASHLGVLLDRPTIGCAKTRLVGEHGEPGPKRGSQAPLVHQGEVVGVALRTRDRCRPIYVSVGHRISLQSAIGFVLACSRYRIPEPTRLADLLSRR